MIKHKQNKYIVGRIYDNQPNNVHTFLSTAGPSLKEQEDDEIETLERRVKTYKYALIGSLVIFVIILTVEAAMIFSGGFGMCYTKNTPYSLVSEVPTQHVLH